MTSKRYVLFSIKPPYAKLILEGSKTIELRTKIPKLQKGDILVFYESSPVKMITFTAEVDKVIIAKPEILWNQYHASLGLSKQSYDSYFKNHELAYGIRLSNIIAIQHAPIDSILGKEQRPPQSFRYLSLDVFESILLRKKERTGDLADAIVEKMD